MGFAETSAALWRQRELLSRLLYTVDVEALVLVSGQARWLGTATHDVELALHDVRAADLLRAVLADELADELGLPDGASLADIASAAEEPWRDVFTEHRSALTAISADIATAVRENKERLSAGARAIREALGEVPGGGALYDAGGRPAPAATGARLVDEAL